MKNNMNIIQKYIENKNLFGLTVELTSKCNWRCKHCYIDDYSINGLTYEDVYNLLCESRNLGAYEVLFTGGELFMREDALEIIALARKMFFNVKLFTNISLLNADIINKLDRLNVSEISCTLFSIDANTHDLISGVKGSYSALMVNLEILKKTNIKIEIKTILMKYNKFAYREIRNFCIKNGFSYLATTNIFASNSGNMDYQSLLIDESDLYIIIPEIDEIREFAKIERDELDYICKETRYNLFVNAQGDVFPCNNMPIVIGNVKIDGISAIWHFSPKLRHLQGQRWSSLKKCSKCSQNEFCIQCSGINLLEGGKLDFCNLQERTNAEIRIKHNKCGEGD